MAICYKSTIYESEKLRAVTGPAIRPGGVELTGHAVEFCSFPAGSRLLDVGCGEGATVGFLRERYRLDAFGADISSRLVADGKSRFEELPLLLARAESLPCGDCSLDGILCECVLSILPEPEKALREFHRALVPGGKLILSDIYLRGERDEDFFRDGGVDGCLEGARPSDFTITLLIEAGFEVLLWENHTRLLRELAARLVLANGAAGALLEEINSPCRSLAGHSNGSSIKPGYYLMVAGKS